MRSRSDSSRSGGQPRGAPRVGVAASGRRQLQELTKLGVQAPALRAQAQRVGEGCALVHGCRRASTHLTASLHLPLSGCHHVGREHCALGNVDAK